jgi:ribonuclease P protein component
VPPAVPGGAGFPQAERLTKRADFVRLQDQPGARIRAKSFLLLVGVHPLDAEQAGGPSQPPRAGFVASKRLGNAVARNRAKRLLRELFRRNKGRFPRDVDLVFIALSSILEKKLPDLEAELAAVASDIDRRTRGLAARGPATQAPPRPKGRPPWPPSSSSSSGSTS